MSVRLGLPAHRWVAVVLLFGTVLTAFIGPSSLRLTVYFGDLWQATPAAVAVLTAGAQVIPLWFSRRAPVVVLAVVAVAFLAAQAFAFVATPADLAVFVALAVVGRHRSWRVACAAAAGFALALAVFMVVAAPSPPADAVGALIAAGVVAAAPTALGAAFRRVAQRHTTPEAGPPLTATESNLTPRERMVLERIAEGKTNAEIAAELFIGAETVKSHVSNILNKLGARDRTQAVTLAIRAGVLTTHPPSGGEQVLPPPGGSAPGRAPAPWRP